MGTFEALVPLGSAIILGFLTYDLVRRYQHYKGTHRHLLFWAIGLGMFAVASLCDAILHVAWNEFAFIGWFVFGAVLNPAWIGEGTLFLLVRRQWVTITAIVLALASIVIAVVVLSAPLEPNAYVPGVAIADQYKNILPVPAVRATIPIFNIYGTVLIVGGALYSGWLFYRKRILPNRVLGNVLIAAGALAVASAGVLASLGLGQFHSFAQLLFSVLMYVGFVMASRPAAVQPGEAVVRPRAAATK